MAVELSSWKRSSQTNSKDCIWIVDESKQVATLRAFKLPVEVVQYGAENLFRHFEQKVTILLSVLADDQRFVTDQGNFIIDLDLKVIEDAEALANELDHNRRGCRARFILEHDFKK